MNKTVSIREAATLLQVTDKTIRNYIKRGFLHPEKWNGMWQIGRDDVLEIYEKKNRTSGSETDLMPDPTPGSTGEIRLSIKEYSAQMIDLGKLHVYEGIIKEQNDELDRRHERLSQLEASSAAGWTEARTAQTRCESLKQLADQSALAEGQSKEALLWLQREKDRVDNQLRDQVEVNRTLLLRIRELEDQLHVKSLYE
jgi:hypothetical protein